MQYKANTPDEYISLLPTDRVDPFNKLRNVILQNLPAGFEEQISYGMIGYVVPLSIYPAGYHCDPKLPVPFASIGSQKNFIAFYHMGMYGNPKLLNWFITEYTKHSKHKLDMGKSCVRLKYFDEIPYELIGQLMHKISLQDWLKVYIAMDPRSRKSN